MPSDPVRARQCALLEWQQESHAPLYQGDSLLTIIYANGQGAQKNIDLATAFVCESPPLPAPAEFWGW
ncbi:MAG: hypothetical protein ACYCSH_12015 [Acidithiobacillus sp.]